MKSLPMTLVPVLVIGISPNVLANDSVTLRNEAQWKQATATAEQVTVGQHGLTLQQTPEGRLRFGIYGHDQRWHLVRSSEPLSRDWYHAVGTFDGRQVRLYLNGSLQRHPGGESHGQFRGYVNRPRPGAAKPPSAGSSAPLGHYGFQGAIARLRLLDQAMADDEIREVYRIACESVPAIDRRAEDGCGIAND